MGRLPGTSKVGISTPNPAGTGELYFEIDAIIYTDVSQKFPADNQQATRVDALVCTFYAGVKATFIDPDKYARAKLVEATSRATETDAPPPPPRGRRSCLGPAARPMPRRVQLAAKFAELERRLLTSEQSEQRIRAELEQVQLAHTAEHTSLTVRTAELLVCLSRVGLFCAAAVRCSCPGTLEFAVRAGGGSTPTVRRG
jgi:hypothetical protein